MNEFMVRLSLYLSMLLLPIGLIGCSRGPEAIKPPAIDVSDAASKAIELYDTNKDGKLSKEELARCPGILGMIKEYDQNGDGAVDEEEISARLTHLFRHGTGATQLMCTVRYDGRALPGAQVVFEPESYLGDDIEAAEGTTNGSGTAQVAIPSAKVPDHLKRLKLIRYGTFKVRITHPTTKLPPKYNTETTLGYETVAGDPYVTFTLTGT